MTAILAALGVAILLKGAMYLVTLLGGSFQRTRGFSTVQAELVEVLFAAVCLYGVFLWIDEAGASPVGPVLVLVIATLLISLSSVFSYVIRPIIAKRSGPVHRAKNLEITYARLLGNTQVYTTPVAADQAYAVQLSKGYGFVLISERIVEEFSEGELGGLIAHELAHVRLTHNFKLYIATVLGILCGLALWAVFAAELAAFCPNSFLRAAICGGLFIVIPLGIIPALLHRMYEHQADRYAATTTSAVQVEAMLRHLDELSLGSVSRGGFTYPGLAARVRYLYM